VVGELRSVREDLTHICAAETDRLDLLRATVSDGQVHSDVVPAKLDTLHDDLVGDLGVHLASGRGVDPDVPALRVDTGADPSNAQTVHLSDADQTWLASNETAIRGDLWFLVGLLCCAPFSFYFLRTVLL